MEAIRAGGSFRVVLHPSTLDYVDPALAYTVGGWALLDATCAKLMNFPDKSAPAGTRLIPEVAAGYPRVSRDARTFTFRLRRDFRFSTNQAVRPSSFARAIARILALGRKHTRTRLRFGHRRGGGRESRTRSVCRREW